LIQIADDGEWGMKSIILIILALSTFNVTAAVKETVDVDESKVHEAAPVEKQDWFNHQHDGWFSYIDPELVEDPDKNAKAMPSINESGKDPLVELKELQEKVERAKALAVLHPTKDHVYEWIKVNRELLDRSAVFSDVAQRTVWQHPELDYSLDRPANPMGMKVWADDYNAAKAKAFREIAEDHGLFFIFTAGCKYCHAMAPYIKRFADTYGFSVVAMSADGSGIAEFPNSRYEPEVIKRLNPKAVPAIYLVNPKDDFVEPIAFGAISLKQLGDRIYRLFRIPSGQPMHKVVRVGSFQ